MSISHISGSVGSSSSRRLITRRRLLTGGLTLALGIGGVSWFRKATRTDSTGLSPVESLIGRAPASGLTPSAGAVDGRQALELCGKLLRSAEQTLVGIDGMKAVFHKQERIDGTLQDPHVIDVKIRRAPLSVYLRWRNPDEGQEVLWMDGANDGQMVVHPGGWRGRLLASIKIDPQGDRAMEGSRRPIYNIGPWNMTTQLLDYVKQCEAGEHTVTIAASDAKIGAEECHCFQFNHPLRTPDLEFQQVVVYIEKRRSLPIAVENYGWARDEMTGQPQLEESYVFNEMQLDPGISDSDFDMANPAYGFIRR